MNQQELKHILSSKFDFEKWKDLLGTMFLKIDYLTKPIQIEAALVKSGGQVGMIRLDDGRSLGLFKFEVADNIKIARNRKGLRDIAIKYVDQDITHGALVFYYSEDQADYRLTFVSKQTSLNEDGEFVPEGEGTSKTTGKKHIPENGHPTYAEYFNIRFWNHRCWYRNPWTPVCGFGPCGCGGWNCEAEQLVYPGGSPSHDHCHPEDECGCKWTTI